MALKFFSDYKCISNLPSKKIRIFYQKKGWKNKRLLQYCQTWRVFVFFKYKYQILYLNKYVKFFSKVLLIVVIFHLFIFENYAKNNFNIFIVLQLLVISHLTNKYFTSYYKGRFFSRKIINIVFIVKNLYLNHNSE